eukprot:COSAG01_NODE_6434_length_3669_cov_1.916527_2_plen_176_part_00
MARGDIPKPQQSELAADWGMPTPRPGGTDEIGSHPRTSPSLPPSAGYQLRGEERRGAVPARPLGRGQVSRNGQLLGRRGRSFPANACGVDTHRDSISSRVDRRTSLLDLLTKELTVKNSTVTGEVSDWLALGCDCVHSHPFTPPWTRPRRARGRFAAVQSTRLTSRGRRYGCGWR